MLLLAAWNLIPSSATFAMSDWQPAVVVAEAPENRDAPSAKLSDADRLKNVEAELKKLTDAEQKRKDDAAKKPSLTIGGQIQADALVFRQSKSNVATVGDVPDGTDFRRARLTGRGEVFEFIEYGIGFDFALTGRPSFLDVFVGVRELPYLGTLRVGHFFEPLSLERMTPNRYGTFMERSLADTFAPARNFGVCAGDAIGAEQRTTWSAGVFASTSSDFGDQFSDDGGRAFTTRLTFLPFYDDASNGRSYLHLGGGFSHRTPTNRAFVIQAFPEARPGAPPAAAFPPFLNTGAIHADSGQIFNAEACWTAGPLSVQAECFYVPVDQIGGPNLAFHGAYAYVSYFLTGEHRPYNKQLGFHDRVIPHENFFRVRTCDGPAETGFGAWEVAARVSFIDLTDKNIAGGVENNFTLGLNWYLNPFTRVKAQYIFCDLDRPPVGDSTAHIFGMRVDIDF
jgi:phosphate-selective porin OprO/OprP